jgi:hypothetical protein
MFIIQPVQPTLEVLLPLALDTELVVLFVNTRSNIEVGLGLTSFLQFLWPFLNQSNLGRLDMAVMAGRQL